MIPKIYNWKRFWCAREGRLNLYDDGYLWDPDSEFGSIHNPGVVSFDALSQTPCLALLGEPGMGKSTAMLNQKVKIDNDLIAKGDSSLWIDLKAFNTA
jgi:hypothetical protein